MKRTKIVCTLGPASAKASVLEKMMRNGMNVARLNFSHGSYADHKKMIAQVRKSSKKVNRTIALLQDLQGPRIRIGDVVDVGIVVKKNNKVVLMNQEMFDAGKKIKDHISVPIQYGDLYKDVSKGSKILIEDGKIQLKVTGISKEKIKTSVVVGGTIKNHKGMNVPGVSISAEIITEKDKSDVDFGVSQGVDYVALSFVKDAADIIALRRRIKRLAKKYNKKAPGIIAKIERQEALDNFESILEAVDGIMIARGDLGLEVPASEVPIWQKNMILRCLVTAKPVIVATQMLDSMTENLQPTRAEISDVANAVIDHTDAVMLSAESAVGKYPAETVKIMAETIQNTEDSEFDDFYNSEALAHDTVEDHLIWAATYMAYMVEAPIIITLNVTENMVRFVSRYRPEVIMLAITPDKELLGSLPLFWGVEGRYVSKQDSTEKYVQKAMAIIKKERLAKKGQKIVFLGCVTKPADVMDAMSVITME